MTAPILTQILQNSPLLPKFLSDNIQVTTFLLLLTYSLLLINWLVTTDWLDKFHLFSGALCAIGILHLHYSEVLFVAEYEVPFVIVWLVMIWYHGSTWRNNYTRVCGELYQKGAIPASMRPFVGSIFRYFIVVPTTKNASNQWNPPPFKNVIHVVLVLGYGFLLGLHVMPFFTPVHCLSMSDDWGSFSFGLPLFHNSFNVYNGTISSSASRFQSSPSLLCCRYNYAISSLQATSLPTTPETAVQSSVQSNYCSGRVRIAFAGSWSTGKTYLLSALLGHNYSTAQSAPAPTTDKFTCVVAGAPYDDPVRSDDYERRRHCEIMEHVNDVVRGTCSVDGMSGGVGGKGHGQGGTAVMPNVLDVADTNMEFDDFVFFDMPGWQTEYANECIYRTFFQQLIDKVDFTYVVWDVNHGKIEEEFASFFRTKARGLNYELIYNRFTKESSDMAFLNQQYAKMATGQEILSQMYTTKVHENNTEHAVQFERDVLLLRSKIKSVNQTVHDNRKKMMKENLIRNRDKITGINSLRRLKICDRLIQEDLNLHVQPRSYRFKWLGMEL